MGLNADLPALPKGWVWTRVGEIAYTTSGGTPSRKIKAYFNGNIPWLKSGELKDSFIYNSEETISEEALKNSSAKIFPVNTILIALYGATVGRLGILKIEASTNQAICVILNKYNTYYNKYLFYFLMSFRNKLINKRFGGAQPNISQEIVRDVIFPLPPLPEQHRIVNKIEELFTKLDAGVDALKKIKIQLKRYRQSVLKNAFEGKLTQQWREAHKGKLEPASVLLEKIKEQRKKEFKGKFKELPPIDTSELPELPEGWVWTRVDCITQNITKGSTPTSYGFSYKKEGIKFIKTENITEDGIIANIKDFIDEDANNFLKRSILQTNDILFSIAGTIGRVGLVQERDLPANTNQALSLIRLFSENIVNKYVFYFLRSPYIQKQSLKSIVGVGRANITLTDVSNYNIPLPPLSEQHQIVSEIERRLSVADQLEKVVEQSLKQAERLRQSILKQAFEGKLVPQDPTDEPAEKLLERIKEEKESRGLANEKSRKRK